MERIYDMRKPKTNLQAGFFLRGWHLAGRRGSSETALLKCSCRPSPGAAHRPAVPFPAARHWTQDTSLLFHPSADQAECAAPVPLHGRVPQAARAQHLCRGADSRGGGSTVCTCCGNAELLRHTHKQTLQPAVSRSSVACRCGARTWTRWAPRCQTHPTFVLTGSTAFLCCCFLLAGAGRVRGQGGRQDARPVPHLLGSHGAPGGQCQLGWVCLQS